MGLWTGLRTSLWVDLRAGLWMDLKGGLMDKPKDGIMGGLESLQAGLAHRARPKMKFMARPF